ncbi:jmjC domain-containing protein 5-like [Anoplophora glabripennis]|uniref:jmjC domain-containing protein 5-like n=1 Tax=Anoplophora glabripennis TaxID=217634 RepID=UPI0008741DF9|nr:jmjC domain-containing protein 5-like [Anoplophora glabripennis]
MNYNKIEDLSKTLKKFIISEDELVTFRNINSEVIKILQDCFSYSLKTGKDEKKSFEIESVLDYLQDELNTGHWSEVPIHIRHCFTSASFIKCLIILKSAESFDLELLRKCVKCLDMGLLLGAPLRDNFELLTTAAKYISELITKVSEHLCESQKIESSEPGKRKFCDYYRSRFEKLNAIEIDGVECPSLEYFHTRYFSTQIPVKLKGCMEHWPATRKWMDVNYLLRIAGDRTVPIEIGSHYADENWSQKLMTLKDFIYKHYLGYTADIGYLAQHNLFEQITELKDDICIPEYCCVSGDYENITEPDINAWFGPRGTVSPLHYDPKNNILAQVYGTKQLLLFSQSDSPYLYPHDSKLLCNTAQVDPLAPDLQRYPEFVKCKMYKCLLEPGEMLFIPMKWWHHVTALDKSFSVSFWWQ